MKHALSEVSAESKRIERWQNRLWNLHGLGLDYDNIEQTKSPYQACSEWLKISSSDSYVFIVVT
jgi:hypothetical protein